jgi:hypothetical protein
MLKIRTSTTLARSTGAMAAAAAAFAVLTAGCSEASSAHSATRDGDADVAIVAEIDVTSSVTDSFRTSAKDALAKAIVQLAGKPHGAVDIYLRKIDDCPGCEPAVLGTYHIDAVQDCTENPFDHGCRKGHARAMHEAGVIAGQIRAIHVPVGHAGTNIRSGLAIAGELLASARGEKWLVVASDMRPSNKHRVRPKPVVKLDNVNVVVLFACRQGISLCQERRNAWQAELEHDGAVHPVPFLFSQQMNALKVWR